MIACAYSITSGKPSWEKVGVAAVSLAADEGVTEDG
jgi:hypothetical protein